MLRLRAVRGLLYSMPRHFGCFKRFVIAMIHDSLALLECKEMIRVVGSDARPASTLGKEGDQITEEI